MIGIVRARGNGDANASRDDGEVVVVVVVATKMMKRLCGMETEGRER